MLGQLFSSVYDKFKLNFYKGMLSRLDKRQGSLKASEAFAVEVIHALNEPTVGQFAQAIGISQPNATYRINALIRKGYMIKVPGETDKRESKLVLTEHFYTYYNINNDYIETVMQRIRARFMPDEVAQLEKMLKIISTELMPEYTLMMKGKDEK